MNDETHVLRDISNMLKLSDLPAAIRIELIGKRLDWHEAHVAKDWPRAKEAFGALVELTQLYGVEQVTK
jgi:hypothetical protein